MESIYIYITTTKEFEQTVAVPAKISTKEKKKMKLSNDRFFFAAHTVRKETALQKRWKMDEFVGSML